MWAMGIHIIRGILEDPQSHGAWGEFLQPLLLPNEEVLYSFENSASCQGERAQEVWSTRLKGPREEI